jgi:hypothetical protein
MNIRTITARTRLGVLPAIAAMALLGAGAAVAEEAKPAPDYGASMSDVTADGTWDCVDNSGATVGAVVVAETTYAFLRPDGILGGYGKLWSLADGPRVPTFVVMDGYLKDELGVHGAAMGGPKDDNQNYAGELFLRLVITEDNKIECARRQPPGA